jgi:hypothetical protein
MSERVGYARCGSDKQGFSTPCEILFGLDVPEDRNYPDHRLIGATRDRLGLAWALTALRADATLVVPKFDRLARLVVAPARVKGEFKGKQRTLTAPRRLTWFSSTSPARVPSPTLPILPPSATVCRFLERNKTSPATFPSSAGQ